MQLSIPIPAGGAAGHVRGAGSAGRGGRDPWRRGGKVSRLRCRKVLLRGWTSTSGPCHLPWIPLSNVNALACRRGQSLKSDFGSSVLLVSVCSPILCKQLMGLWQCLLFSWVPVYSGHHLRTIWINNLVCAEPFMFSNIRYICELL